MIIMIKESNNHTNNKNHSSDKMPILCLNHDSDDYYDMNHHNQTNQKNHFQTK